MNPGAPTLNSSALLGSPPLQSANVEQALEAARFSAKPLQSAARLSVPCTVKPKIVRLEEVEMNTIRRDKRRQWALVAERLVHTSSQYVPCPECGEASLQIRDMEYGGGQHRGLDRYLLCSHCGRFNAVNLRHAGTLVEAHLIAAEEACMIAAERHGRFATPNGFAPGVT
jgi:hypothetical protein